MNRTGFQRFLTACAGAALVLMAAMVANSQSLGVYTDKLEKLYPERIGAYELVRDELKTVYGDDLRPPATGNGIAKYKHPKTGNVLILNTINFAKVEQAESTLIGKRETDNLSFPPPSKVEPKLMDGKVVGKRFTESRRGSDIIWTNGSVYFHLSTQAKINKKYIDLVPLERAIGH